MPRRRNILLLYCCKTYTQVAKQGEGKVIMKKYFYLGIAIILIMALAIVGYGAWLNYSDEHQIANRMDNRKVQLSGATVARRQLHPTLTLPAVRFTSENMADAVALTEGRITHWQVGKNSPVQKGDLLLSMANEQIPLKIQQAASAVRRAEAVLAQAYSAYQRQGRLIAKNATAQEKYEESRSQYLAAQEALREAEAQYQQSLVMEDRLQVTAPVSGEVLLIYQREGAYVQAGTPVALVGDFDRLSFSMNLPDEDTRHLRVGENSVMAFPQGQDLSKVYDTDYATGNVGWGQKVRATLKDIVPPLAEPAEMRRTVWEVDNRTRTLEPMTYTGVRMVTGQSYTCLTVPLSAMVDGNYDKVYVLDDEGRLRLRQVRTGTDDDSYIEIYEGLQEVEVVVTGNMEGLHEGMKAEISLEGGGH